MIQKKEEFNENTKNILDLEPGERFLIAKGEPFIKDCSYIKIDPIVDKHENIILAISERGKETITIGRLKYNDKNAQIKVIPKKNIPQQTEIKDIKPNEVFEHRNRLFIKLSNKYDFFVKIGKDHYEQIVAICLNTEETGVLKKDENEKASLLNSCELKYIKER